MRTTTPLHAVVFRIIDQRDPPPWTDISLHGSEAEARTKINEVFVLFITEMVSNGLPGDQADEALGRLARAHDLPAGELLDVFGDGVATFMHQRVYLPGEEPDAGENAG